VSDEPRRWALHLAVPGTHDGPAVSVVWGELVPETFREASWRQWGEAAKIGPASDRDAYWDDRDHLVMVIPGAHMPHMAFVIARGLVDRFEMTTGVTFDRHAEWSGAVLTDADEWARDAREIGRRI